MINKLEGRCAAIINAWFPSEEGGNAIADILTGKVNPSAKLSVSYPNTQKKEEVNYQNGYAKNNQPLYPFGYGMSYTRYKYSNFEMKSIVNITDDRFSISFDLENIGKVDGTEIVQLYMSPVDENSTMKAIQLKRFLKSDVKIWRTKKMSFKVSPEQLVQFKNHKLIVESGKYEFKIGASSTDIKLKGQTLLKGEDLFLKNGRTIFFSENEIK